MLKKLEKNLDSKLTFTVSEGTPERLDKVVTRLCESFPRSAIQSWIEEGRVTINSVVVTKVATIVTPPYHLIVSPPEEQPQMDFPTLAVLYEDKHTLVIDKPPTIAVHTGHTHLGAETTIEDILKTLPDFSFSSDAERYGIVHRLDKQTSGVLLLAKNQDALAYYQQLFRSRSLHKKYLAVVVGNFPKEHVMLESLMERHRTDREKMTISLIGKQALTEVHKVHSNSIVSLLSIHLHTGRTHQIRVHLAHMGYPVVGDVVYGKPDAEAKRQLLHASSLEFVPYTLKKAICISAPLPSDFKHFLKQQHFPSTLFEKK